MVSVNVTLSQGVSVWIGRATTKLEDVVRIEQRLRWTEAAPNFENIWLPTRNRSNQSAP